jgi:hypothetical protein
MLRGVHSALPDQILEETATSVQKPDIRTSLQRLRVGVVRSRMHMTCVSVFHLLGPGPPPDECPCPAACQSHPCRCL